jgi:hypothetical protein
MQNARKEKEYWYKCREREESEVEDSREVATVGLARLDRVPCGGSGLGAAVPRFGSAVQGLGLFSLVSLALRRLCCALCPRLIIRDD